MEEKTPSTPPVVSQPAPSAPAMPAQKPLSIIKVALILLVVILVLGGGGYFLHQMNSKQATVVVSPTPTVSVAPSSTPDPTANWKTYTSKNLPFTFQYPQGSSISENKISDFYALAIFFPGIDISIAPTKDTDSACAGSLGVGNKAYQTTIGNQLVDGTETIFPDGRSSTCKSILYNSYYFVIQFSSQNTQLKTLVNQILSTFKFTDQNQLLETANWKTYIDTKYGFSFQYPSGWEQNVQTGLTQGYYSVYVIPPGFENHETPPLFFVHVRSNPNNLSPTSFIKEIQLYMPDGSLIKQITIDGVNGIRVPLESAAGNDSILINHNSKIYQIGFEHNPDEKINARYDNTFSQFFSTFKFTQ